MIEDNNFPTFLSLAKEEQKLALESLIFSAEEPLNTRQIVNMLTSVEINVPFVIEQINKDIPADKIDLYIEKNNDNLDNYIENLIKEISNDLLASGRPYKIVNIAGTWQFAIATEYGKLINSHFKIKSKKRLTQAALEALAIICYRQPISKPEIEQIRGVNSNEIVNSLLEKNLIKIAGRSESLGKPLLYATTQEFLRVFGLDTLDDLPKLKELDELNLNEKLDVEGLENSEELVIKLKEEYILNSEQNESVLN